MSHMRLERNLVCTSVNKILSKYLPLPWSHFTVTICQILVTGNVVMSRPTNEFKAISQQKIDITQMTVASANGKVAPNLTF